MAEEEIEEDPRFRIGKREALTSLVLYVVFWGTLLSIAWWGMTKSGVSYILGLPDWFFYSVFVTYLIFAVIAILMALRLKETPLTPWLEEE